MNDAFRWARCGLIRPVSVLLSPRSARLGWKPSQDLKGRLVELDEENHDAELGFGAIHGYLRQDDPVTKPVEGLGEGSGEGYASCPALARWPRLPHSIQSQGRDTQPLEGTG